MIRLLALFTLVMSALPAEAQRVCQQVGQTVQCSDGAYLLDTQSPRKPPPKEGTFQYYSSGTVCQVFGKQRFCK